VQVLDAMAARGISFRALYVLGLNEKFFPRHIREDAFLRDGPRRFLDADLGFKIQEKLAGYDEEKLLFRLLCDAARHHLMLLYQRTDDAGRMLVPSGYLADIRSQAGGTDVTVPRRLTKKFEEGTHYRIDRLTQVEAGIKFLLDRTVPHRLLNVMHPAGRLVERGLRVLRAQERGESRLGAYDGMTGPLEPFWVWLKSHGVSPTALQEYATCPFRYFAKQVLRLEPLVIPDIEEQIGPIELGVLAHGILRLCLQKLREQGYFTQPSRSTVELSVVLEEAARRVFDRFAGAHPVGFPLVWDLHRENLVGFLHDVLRDDLAELSAAGWEPVLFEEPMNGTVEVAGASGESGTESFPVVGRLDRVDWSASRNAYRIIDYKFKVSREPETLDKNLALGAVRGLRFQPPLYLAIARAGVPARLKQEGAEAASACAEVWFYYLASRWEHRDGQALTRASFPGDAWSSGLRGPLERVVSYVIEGIKSGRFFIYSDGYCDRCDYRLICRKTHQPTSWRARSDRALVKPHREIRRAQVSGSRAESRADAHAGRPKDSAGHEAKAPAAPRPRRRSKPAGAAGEEG
jgi:ATP-dependent helicase/nuclease subunit B